MFHPITFSIIIILFFYAVFYIFKKQLKGSSDVRSNIKLKLPPSPPKIPILGNFHQLTLMIHRCFHCVSALYGPIVLLHWATKPILVVSSAEMASEIIKTHDVTFADRFVPKTIRVIFFGGNDLVFAPYGERWRQLRKFCVLELLTAKRVQSFKYVREEEVDKVMEKIAHSSRQGDIINLTETISTMLNSIIFRCSLGDNFNKDYTQKFIGLIKMATRLMESAFSFEDYFPWLKWMDVITGLDRKLKRTSEEINTFLNQIIDDHLLSGNSCVKHSDHDNKRNFIELLLLHAEKQPNLHLTRDNIKGIILDMFIAGSETTATVVDWAIAELIKNPKLMKKAQEEVRRVVGNKMKVEEHDINQMDYLKCIVKESLRLHPPVPSLLGRNSSANVKIGGYDIPANTVLFINAYTIQRDPESWDKPEEFYPERFENNPIDFKGQDLEFIPFGSGRRGCPGMSFGLAVVEFVLANLLHGFDWELPGGANKEELDMSEGSGFSINRKKPLLVVPVLFRSTSSGTTAI